MHLDRESVFAGVEPFRIKRERVAPGVSAVSRESFKINLAISRHPKSFPKLFAVQIKNRTIIDVVCDPDQRRLNVLRNLESRPEIIGDLALLINHRRAQRHLQTIVLVAQQPGAAAPFRIVEIDGKPVTSQGVAGIFKSPFVIQRQKRFAGRLWLLAELFSGSTPATIHPRLHLAANLFRNVVPQRAIELSIKLNLRKNRVQQLPQLAAILRLDLRVTQQAT